MRKTRTNKRRRGGDSYRDMTGVCNYNVNDKNARVSTDNPYELQKIYQTCCPKSRFGFKNSKPLCKNLNNQFRMLQEARNFENKEVFEKDNLRYLRPDDEDYYKPRNAILSPDDEEFSEEFKENITTLGGRPKKTRKTRKTRKSRR